MPSEPQLRPGNPPRLIAAVEAWLREISPGTRIKNLNVLEDLDLVRATFAFERTGQGETREYRPTNVGFGISYTLPVLVAILSSKPGSLLLLENPEAHLHPKGQFQIGDLIACAASSGTQVLLRNPQRSCLEWYPSCGSVKANLTLTL